VDVQSIIREASSAAYVLSVLVLGTGYYFLVSFYQEWMRQSRRARTAGGRPLVVVNADYSHLPTVSLVVQNFTKAPAKEITFDFSAPVEDSSGFVLSDLRFFKEGLPFLEPEAQIAHYWDYLPNLIPMLKERGLEDGIKVTTRYKDLADESYETEWTLHPLLLESDHRIERSKDMNDLVNVAEEISGAGVGRDGRQKAANGGEGHSEPR